MKLSHCVIFAALAASLAAGCSRRPKNITPLPATDRVGGTQTAIEPNGGVLGTGSQSGGNQLGGIPPGVPFRSGAGSGGIDLPPSGGGNTSPLITPLPPGDSAQADRSKWESWPQDPDTLRGNTVYFDFDKSVVKSSERAKVAALAEHIKGHPSYMLKLDGHADERGTEDYNRALGERRALGVRETLLNLGVPAESVITATFGEDRPADLGHNEAAWAKNRRVEAVLLIPPGAKR